MSRKEHETNTLTMSAAKENHPAIKDGRKISGTDDVSYNLTEEENVLLDDIRQLPTMQERANFIVGTVLESEQEQEQEAFYSLLAKEPSIVWETKNQNTFEKSLLQYLCSHHDCLENKRKVQWARLLTQVLQAYPEGLPDDPLRFIVDLAMRKLDFAVHEELLDFVGMLTDHVPIPPEPGSALPELEVGWRRLVASDGQSDSTSGIALFDRCPHLIHYLFRLSIELDGIEGSDESILGDDGLYSDIEEDMTQDGLTQEPRLSLSIRSQFPRRILDHIVKHRGMEHLFWRGPFLDITLEPPSMFEDMSWDQTDCCLIEASSSEGGFVGSVLPIILKYDLPMHQLFSDLYALDDRHGEDVLQQTRLLEGCRVHYWSVALTIWTYPKAQDIVDAILRRVAQHATMREFHLHIIGDQLIDISLVADLVNQDSISLFRINTGDISKPLIDVLKNTNGLQRLAVKECRIVQSVPLFKAVGQSTCLREFTFAEHAPHYLAMASLLKDMETSNTTLVRIRSRPLSGPDTEWNDLLAGIGYYCDLNRIGRAKLWHGDLSKADFVMNMLSIFETDGEILKELCLTNNEPPSWSPDAAVISLLYGLLRETPALWST